MGELGRELGEAERQEAGREREERIENLAICVGIHTKSFRHKEIELVPTTESSIKTIRRTPHSSTRQDDKVDETATLHSSS